MLLVIIFGLIFLIGVSLFVALVGTAMLRKRARTVYTGPPRRYPQKPYARQVREPVGIRMPTGEGASGPDYGARFREEYREEVEEAREEAPPESREPTRAAAADTFRPAYPGYAPSPATRSAGGKVVAVILILAVIVIAVYILTSDFVQLPLKEYKLSFCEYVDYTRLKPVNKSDTFIRGNVTLFLISRGPIGYESARVEIYRLGEDPELYSFKNLPLKPSWTSFSVKLLFEELGTYSVSVYGEDGVIMAQDNIYIVPDTFVYKPVPVVLSEPAESESDIE